MDYRSYVEQNQKVIDFVKDITPGHIDRYTGTLDHACARFHTILLALSQDPLKADQHRQDVQECFDTIQGFYNYTEKLTNSHRIFHPFIKMILHWKGIMHIPKIKILHEKINN